MCAVEANRRRLKPPVARCQKSPRSEQHQRQCDLDDDDRLPKVYAPSATTETGARAAVLQVRVEIDARRLHRRHESEGERGERADRDGERDDANVHAWSCKLTPRPVA